MTTTVRARLAAAWSQYRDRAADAPPDAGRQLVTRQGKEELEVLLSRDDLHLHQLIGNYSEQGRQSAAAGDLGRALRWLAKAELACQSRRLQSPMAQALAESHVLSAEAYLAMSLKDYEDARAKLCRCIDLCVPYNQPLMQLRAFHLFANLVRLDALHSATEAAAGLLRRLILSRSCPGIEIAPGWSCGMPPSREVLDFQWGQAVTEFALLDCTAETESCRHLHDLFRSNDLHPSAVQWQGELQEWYRLRRSCLFDDAETFVEGVCGFLEHQPGTYPVFGYLLAFSAATMAGDQSNALVKQDIARCRCIPASHKLLLAKRDRASHQAVLGFAAHSDLAPRFETGSNHGWL